MCRLIYSFLLSALLLYAAGCSNTPYPGEGETDDVVLYSSFSQPPKDLDPQRTYTVADATFLSQTYERLLGYDYLARPLKLRPELALAVPEPRETRDENGKITEVRYAFEIQPDVHYIDDPCFEGGQGREVKASDFLYAFKRVADPETNCPVVDSFSHIKGFKAFRERLIETRKTMMEEEKAKGTKESDIYLSSAALYERAGELEGIEITGDYTLELVMDHSYPQILFWLAMRFVCAIPHEAVDVYNGSMESKLGGEPMEFRNRPVGTGPYKFDWAAYNRQSKIVMVRNPEWWGLKYPERKAYPASFPLEPGESTDREAGRWSEARAGQPITPPDRIEWYLERETLSRFNKFLQGYYDASGIPVESFNQVVQEETLTPAMEEKGIQLVKDIGIDVYYIAFNMNDDQIGAPLEFKDPKLEANREAELEKRRKVRQAMSLAVDAREYLRIFNNGLGIPAHSPLPPALFGYDPEYKNTFRQYDPELVQARQLLKEAGFENGIDPDTGEALQLTFNAGDASSRARIRYNFFIDAWKKLGLNVQLDAADYNTFQKKVYSGNFQIIMWGWLADYPDPENFLFLLYGPNSGKYSGHNPNHSWYESPEYDVLFKQMETIKDQESATWEVKDPATGEMKTVTHTRYEIIREMIAVLENDVPWIPLMHSEDFLLYHAWMSYVKPHPITGSWSRFYQINKDDRAARREEWNRPIMWPAYVMMAAVVLFLVPGIIMVRRERR